MSKGWTPERRARQAAAIQRWQPWVQSTGPRSPDGKVRSACNADKGGEWRETRDLIKEMNQLMRQQQEALGEIEEVLFTEPS